MRCSIRGLCASALSLIVLTISGCATPVGVKHVDNETAYRTLYANILSSGTPGAYSTQLLERHALVERYQREPEKTLAELYSGLGKADERDRLFALAELSFAHAEVAQDQSYYLSAAVFAYAFLFPTDPKDAPDAYDPRLRLAIDLYNQGLANGLATRDGSEVDLSPRQIMLPFGSLDLQAEPDFRYAGYHLTRFVSLSALKLRGLRNRYRDAGIGAPLAARVEPLQESAANRWIPSTARVAVTAFVRFDDPRRAMSEERFRGKLEIYDPDETSTVRIGSYTVPLESDSSAALAYRLEGAPIWDFELAGFRRGDFALLGATKDNDSLFMLHPYMPDLIPVVFVHGTASSPARWAEMVNELLGDPNIASHYQLWFFVYNSGNPIALSAMRLRESLSAALKDIDPAGKDPALRQMVVIGHSQGGLLAKMTVVDSGSAFWDRRVNVPFEQAKLDPETRDLARRALFLKPLPFVTRVIFIATPHRGSYLASIFAVKLINKFINLPGGLVKIGVQIEQLRQPGVLRSPMTIPTALDNMDRSNPFLQELSQLPITPGVHAHSIIPVKGNGPPIEGDDGVVDYQSAHIQGVESELIVRSGHSTQSTPETIEEVRRILYEHAGIH